MIEAKQFVRTITRMFNKKAMILNQRDIVSDGVLLYKGDYKDDIFYRLRLEADDQRGLFPDESSFEEKFKKEINGISVSFRYVYTYKKLQTECDVFEVLDKRKFENFSEYDEQTTYVAPSHLRGSIESYLTAVYR